MDANIPLTQEPSKVSRPIQDDGYGNPIIKNGIPVTTRQYHFKNIRGNEILIQEHSYGHVKAVAGKGLEPHFNVRPIDNPNTGYVPGTYGHYNFPLKKGCEL